MSGGSSYGQQGGGFAGGNMYGSEYGRGLDQQAQPGGNMYRQQQPIASQGVLNDVMRRAGGMGTSYTPLGGGFAGGNMGSPTPTPDGFGGPPGYSLTGDQPWQNNPQQTPMDSAFSPTQGMGGPMPTNGLGGFDPRTGAMTGGNMGRPTPMQTEYGMPQPYAAQNIIGKAMTGGNMGGGMGGPMTGRWDGPVAGDPTRGMGGAMPTGGGYGGSSGYSDYMKRRNSWIDQLRGYVAQPAPWGKLPPREGGTPMPNPGAPTPGGPPTAAPPGGPYPGPKAAGGVDHMANLRQLMGEDPRLASEYRTRNGDTINWWQQNQDNVAQGLFGGDQGRMQEWIRSTSPVSSNAAPLSQQEMMRLNQMAGIRGPSWMR